MKILLFILILVLCGCASQEMKIVRNMDIQDIDLKKIDDGEYIGSFSYSNFEYKVKTIIRDHKIKDIIILQNRDTKHSKRAEGVIPRIIKRQTPDVDAVSGASTTSKALMKAVENSLGK